jgi:hypothetical protein
MTYNTKATVQVGDQSESGPFAHNNFSVIDGEQSFSLRLLVHSGAYGFCLLRTSTHLAGSRWHYWRTDGHENGTPYMLIIPQHSDGKKTLRSLSHDDLEQLAKAFELIIVAIERHGAHDLHRWQLVAALCHFDVSASLASYTHA